MLLACRIYLNFTRTTTVITTVLRVNFDNF